VYTGVERLCALAAALVMKAVGFLGNVLFEEVGIVGDHGFKFVIEHDRSGLEIAGLPYPFGGPNRTDDVRMPVLAGKAVDILLCRFCQVGLLIRSSTPCQKDVGMRV
jgi:hypothetical protein